MKTIRVWTGFIPAEERYPANPFPETRTALGMMLPVPQYLPDRLPLQWPTAGVLLLERVPASCSDFTYPPRSDHIGSPIRVNVQGNSVHHLILCFFISAWQWFRVGNHDHPPHVCSASPIAWQSDEIALILKRDSIMFWNKMCMAKKYYNRNLSVNWSRAG